MFEAKKQKKKKKSCQALFRLQWLQTTPLKPIPHPTLLGPLNGLVSPFTPVSLLVLLLLVLLAILGGLGGQGAHSISNGLVVGIHAWKVLQDTLEEFGVLHHVIIILLLQRAQCQPGEGAGCRAGPCGRREHTATQAPLPTWLGVGGSSGQGQEGEFRKIPSAYTQ